MKACNDRIRFDRQAANALRIAESETQLEPAHAKT
jgi:hypothetical protein